MEFLAKLPPSPTLAFRRVYSKVDGESFIDVRHGENSVEPNPIS